jgi:hypothetical protein
MHLVLAGAWVALIIPTILFWADSVLWVAFASLYANCWLHLDGYGAARAEESD